MQEYKGHQLVEFTEYVAKDGKVFEDKEECILYEKKLDGLIKECPDCNGKGEISEEVIEEDYHSGAPYHTHQSRCCPKCQGKGYLEKKLKEVWE